MRHFFSILLVLQILVVIFFFFTGRFWTKTSATLPQSPFMYFIWISEQTAIVSLYINILGITFETVFTALFELSL
jgi:hypothetical protein